MRNSTDGGTRGLLDVQTLYVDGRELLAGFLELFQARFLPKMALSRAAS